MSIFINGRTLSCLVCLDSRATCSYQGHPLQRLMSYEELIAKYALKINRDQYDGIGIYTCPYCGFDRLPIDALYEHLCDVHLHPSIGKVEQNLPEIRCPVCVCFCLDSPAFIQDLGGLAEHMLKRHCFSSTNQYTDEFKLRNDFCCDDESELIRFLATFLPPAIIESQSPLADVDLNHVTNCSKTELQPSLLCPICLEEIDAVEGKDIPLCRHQFHRPCIDRWLAEKNCCPICRCDCSGS